MVSWLSFLDGISAKGDVLIRAEPEEFVIQLVPEVQLVDLGLKKPGVVPETLLRIVVNTLDHYDMSSIIVVSLSRKKEIELLYTAIWLMMASKRRHA